MKTAVYILTENTALLKKYEKELSNIFITSQAYITDKKPENALNEYKEDNYTVYAAKAEGEKCERCWKYRPLGEHSGYETICSDCVNAVLGRD